MVTDQLAPSATFYIPHSAGRSLWITSILHKSMSRMRRVTSTTPCLCHTALFLCFSHPVLVQRHLGGLPPPTFPTGSRTEAPSTLSFLHSLFNRLGISAWKVKVTIQGSTSLLPISLTFFSFLHSNSKMNFDSFFFLIKLLF